MFLEELELVLTVLFVVVIRAHLDMAAV